MENAVFFQPKLLARPSLGKRIQSVAMGELLLYYKRPDPTTWVYMSSFLTIGLFFVFHRFWSIRNLDIALLILLAPGLLMVHEGRRREFRAIASGEIVSQNFRNGLSDEFAVQPPMRTEQTVGSKNGRQLVRRIQVDTSEVETALGASLQSVADDLSEWNDKKPQDDDSPAAEPDPETEPVSAALGYSPQQIQYYGFMWLFAIEFMILIRLLLDSLMTRRPQLHPNLTTGGLYFISISLFVFIMANVVTSTPRNFVEQGPEVGAGYALMHKLPRIATQPMAVEAKTKPAVDAPMDPSTKRWTMVAKILAIAAHLAIVTGIILVGRRHFGNLRAGVGAATMYLLLPYTAQMTGRVDCALPAAMLLWAILTYRKPLFSGIFFGIAAGLAYFPLFLLPLWVSFYWQRGLRRFVIGVAATLTVLLLLLSLDGSASMFGNIQRMFGLMLPHDNPQGIWGLGWNPHYRIPVFVGFIILSVFFATWPSPKNLGSLISSSGALMVAAQFCHGHGGGLFIAWFLPLMLLTIFRPNLQDRVALKVVDGPRDSASRAPLEVKTA